MRLKKSQLKAWLQCNCQRLLVILVTYIIEILTRIMIDNIIPVYIQLLEIPYSFYNIYINDIYSYNIT